MYAHYTLDNLLCTHYEVISVNQCSYDTTQYSMRHTHDFIKIFYYLDGKGHIQTNFGVQSINKNSLIIVNSHIEHTVHHSLHQPLQYIVIHLRGPELIFPDKITDNHLFEFQDDNLRYLRLVQLIIDYMNQYYTHSSYIINHLVNALILTLNHDANALLSEHRKTPLSPSVSLAKNYIDNYYSKHITLDQLKDHSHISKFHLSHLFKEELGISPINYLQEVRFNHAIDLLKNTNFSIVQISAMVGFNSNHYFSRKFKDRYHLSPKDFRKHHRKTITH